MTADKICRTRGSGRASCNTPDTQELKNDVESPTGMICDIRCREIKMEFKARHEKKGALQRCVLWILDNIDMNARQAFDGGCGLYSARTPIPMSS